MRAALNLAVVFAVLVVSSRAQDAITPPTDPARALALALRRIGAEGRLLYVTAHPDDEDNSLLAYYRHGRGFDVTLLTLTRGDGGQNEIGEELFEGIGVLRAEELRSAHRFDGARQRFTRAFEFGYSFSVTETFQKWGEEQILRDVVKVVREVRPHVICTMSISTSGGGRHHQASAFAARRAFDLAAEDIWPELGRPWAPLRLFESARGASAAEPRWSVPTSTYDPILGCTYSELGFRARSFHKCQGTGQVARFSGSTRGRGGRRLAMRRGPPPPKGADLFGGLKVYRDPRTGEPSTTRPNIWGQAGPPSADDLAGTTRRLRRLLREAGPASRGAIFDALSLAQPIHVVAVADRDRLTPGQKTRISVMVHNRGTAPANVNGTFVEARLHRNGAPFTIDAWSGVLRPGERRVERVELTVPADADAWTAVRLVRERDADRYVDALDRLHEPSMARVVVHADVRGLPLRVSPAPVVHRRTNAAFPSSEELDLALLPRVEVELVHDVVPVMVDRPGGLGKARVQVRVRTESPDAYRYAVSLTPRDGGTTKTVVIDSKGAGLHDADFTVEHREGAASRTFDVAVHATDDPRAIAVSCRKIHYPHIRRVFLERRAVGKVVVFPCARPTNVRIGWVEGTGDQVASCLERCGVAIDRLDQAALLDGDLGRYDVIVTGVRAYKVREDLKQAHPRLKAWMEEGGRMVVLYNKSPDMNGGRMARGGSPWTPYTARVGRGRATVEEAPVRMVEKDHRFFRTPNRIGPADWQGWVQERGLYFLDAKDERYQDLLLIDEPWPGNKGAKKGSLVTTSVGRGSWTYVGLALFRQLPAGVPGGYRLLINLLASPTP